MERTCAVSDPGYVVSNIYGVTINFAEGFALHCFLFLKFSEIFPRRRANKMAGKASFRLVRITRTVYKSLQAADTPYILLPTN